MTRGHPGQVLGFVVALPLTRGLRTSKKTGCFLAMIVGDFTEIGGHEFFFLEFSRLRSLFGSVGLGFNRFAFRQNSRAKKGSIAALAHLLPMKSSEKLKTL